MRLSQLAALVANASEEDRVQFFLRCGLPSSLELKKVYELLSNAETKKVALYHSLGQEECLSPHDTAAILFSQWHPELSWHELEDLDEGVFKAIPEAKRENCVDYWGDINPDDPTLIKVIEFMGVENVLVSGIYEIVEVPASVELEYREELYQVDQWDWSRYLTVRSPCELWAPQF